MPTPLLPVSRDDDGEDTRWALSTAAADGEVPAGAAMAVLVPLHDSDAVKLSAWLPIATPRAHEAREELRR